MSKKYTEKHSVSIKGVLNINEDKAYIEVEDGDEFYTVDVMDILKGFATKEVSVSVTLNEEV